MKTVYLISTLILWALILLQIASLVSSLKLRKQAKERIKELDTMCENGDRICREMLAEKAEYQKAKERYLAAELPDFQERDEDDAGNPENGPEFLYSHKDDEIIIRTARCDLKWLVAEISYITNRLYNGIYAKEPETAEVFREYVTLAIAGEDSPTWEKENGYTGDMVITRKAEEVSSDE